MTVVEKLARMRRLVGVLGVCLVVPSTAAAETWTVSSTSDSPVGESCPGLTGCTLRQAVTSANAHPGADDVLVQAGVYDVVNGELTVTEALRIARTGAGTVALELGRHSRAISAIAPLTLEHLTIDEGRFEGGTGPFDQAPGGAILASGTLTLTDVSVTDSETVGIYARGGAVYAGGALTITGGEFSGNRVTGEHAAGGALYPGTTATIAGTRFIENEAEGTSSAAGGAIFPNGALTLDGAELVGNEASGRPGSEVAASGGAIGGIGVQLEISDSVLRENVAAAAGAEVARGGAIDSSAGTLTVTGSLVADNAATGQDLATGGGIHHHGDDLTIDTTRVTGNTASGHFVTGGGVTKGDLNAGSITRSTIDGNEAVGMMYAEGGGVHWVQAGAELTNVTVAGNAARATIDRAAGGGLFLGDDATLTAVTISDNHAMGPSADSGGGGIASFAARPVMLVGSLLAGNEASTGSAECLDMVVSSGGGNLLGDLAGCSYAPGPGDLVTTDPPGLVPLADNGGPTPTMALTAGSPARDRGSGPTCATAADQRGVARPQVGGCDAGAFEAQPAAFAAEPASVSFGDQVVGTTSGARAVTVTNVGDETGTPVVGLDGPDPGAFGVSGCTTAVAPRASCEATVTFAPESPGAKAATMTGAGAGVALTGVGIAPEPPTPPAPPPVPACADAVLATPFGTPVTTTLRCSPTVWSWEIVARPEHGTLSGIGPQGEITYTPDAGFTGTDGFRYAARGASATSEPARVTIQVGPSESRPSESTPVPGPPAACAERRLRVRLNPGGARLRSARVTVDGVGVRATRTKRRWHATFVARPAAGASTVTMTVTARRADGRVVRRTRTLDVC